MPGKTLRWMIVCVCALAGRAGAAEEVDYYALFMDKAKVGHCVETRRVEADRVISTNTMTMTVERMGMPLTVTVTAEDVETVGGEPVSFKVVEDMAAKVTVAEGKIGPDGKLTVTTGKSQQTLDWPKGALLTEGERLLQKRQGLKEGLTYKYTTFDTLGLRPMETSARVVGRKAVDVLGKQETLWEVHIEMPDMTVTLYVTDDLKPRKSLAAQGGIDLGTAVACSKEVALSENTPVDMLSKALLDSPRPVDNLAKAVSVTYRLVPNEGAKITIPNLDTQKVAVDAGGLTVTVSAPKMSTTGGAGADPSAAAALKPTPYLNSDSPEVIALAKQAVGAGPVQNPRQAVRRIDAFVNSYINTKDMSVGYAKASEVVRSRRGDCTEHAVLAAAMCQASGIPAQVVAGIVYMKEFHGRENVFVPHAWVRAYVGGTWVEFDPALLGGYDLGHIAMASGDGSPSDHLNVATAMGAFRIESVEVKPKATSRAAPAVTTGRASPD